MKPQPPTQGLWPYMAELAEICCGCWCLGFKDVVLPRRKWVNCRDLSKWNEVGELSGP